MTIAPGSSATRWRYVSVPLTADLAGLFSAAHRPQLGPDRRGRGVEVGGVDGAGGVGNESWSIEVVGMTWMWVWGTS